MSRLCNMSPKTQPRDPRVAPKEMILTRRKLAQQQRQLRDKDRSMKRITQLLKSPTRTAQSLKKAKVSPKKSPKKRTLQEPVKAGSKPAERRPKKDKVWLKPKPNFKMVAKTNKRKLCTPHREIDSPLPPLKPVSPASPESLDIAQLVQDSDSLDEDDLMEILTCPSPVWWEDPPDPHYSEKPIYTRTPMTQEEKADDKTINEITFNKKSKEANNELDHKFIKKRTKLENILSNIKNKKNVENDDDKLDLDGELLNDEMLKTLENMDIPIEPSVNNNDVKIEKEHEFVVHKNANVVKIKKENKINEINTKLDKNKIAKFKLVNALVVPETLPPLQRNPMHANKILENEVRKNMLSLLEKSDILQGNSSNVDSVLEKHEISKRNTEISNFLEKDGKDIDTISDTNVKFIDNVEDKELDDTSQIILDKIKKFFQEKKAKQKEYITVYKIVDNDEKQEVKNDDQSKINYFYKKCKNVRKKNDCKDTNKSSNSKTLALPNSGVKYCFKCSSIFETKDCHYCAMSETETRECVCDKSQESRGDLSCNNCDLTESEDLICSVRNE